MQLPQRAILDRLARVHATAAQRHLTCVALHKEVGLHAYRVSVLGP